MCPLGFACYCYPVPRDCGESPSVPERPWSDVRGASPSPAGHTERNETVPRLKEQRAEEVFFTGTHEEPLQQPMHTQEVQHASNNCPSAASQHYSTLLHLRLRRFNTSPTILTNLPQMHHRKHPWDGYIHRVSWQVTGEWAKYLFTISV